MITIDEFNVAMATGALKQFHNNGSKIELMIAKCADGAFDICLPAGMETEAIRLILTSILGDLDKASWEAPQ